MSSSAAVASWANTVRVNAGVELVGHARVMGTSGVRSVGVVAGTGQATSGVGVA
jgi:hypothetical protein